MYVPQAGRPPALPVSFDCSWPPLPRSSVPSWTTIVRYQEPISFLLSFSKRVMNIVLHTPKTLSGPISLMNLSVIVSLTLPWPSVLKFPRSPTWRSSSPGAPWVLLKGLTDSSRRVSHQILQSSIHRQVDKGSEKSSNIQCGPADVQPLVLSPNWWMCMPRSALESLPWIS